MKFYPINNNNYTINIPVEGEERQLQYSYNGEMRNVYVGKEEFPGNRRTGMYHEGGDPALSISPAEHSWITISLGAVDDTTTAAPVMYNAQQNLGDTARSVLITLNGNTGVTFNLNQTYTPKLMYMMKNSSPAYGDWIEAARFNNGSVVRSTNLPLRSVTDISIFNGKSGNTYNNITVELQPYRSMDVSFGFARNNTIDSLITSEYSMSFIGGNSSFFDINGSNTVRYQNGYFSFSTNNLNSWTKNGPGGGGVGEIVNVSTHYQFTGSNLPTINLFISNMLSYRVITSYDVKITCEAGGSCFIETAYVDGHESLALQWPSQTGSYIILENCSRGRNILLTYPSFLPEDGGFAISVSSLLNMRYSISISGFSYLDYDGTTKHSTSTLPINVTDDTTILTIEKTWRESGTTWMTALMRFISTASTDKQTFVKYDWPSNVPLENLEWQLNTVERQEGIAISITSNEWRFAGEGTSGASKTTTIGFLSY